MQADGPVYAGTGDGAAQHRTHWPFRTSNLLPATTTFLRSGKAFVPRQRGDWPEPDIQSQEQQMAECNPSHPNTHTSCGRSCCVPQVLRMRRCLVTLQLVLGASCWRPSCVAEEMRRVFSKARAPISSILPASGLALNHWPARGQFKAS